MLGAPFGCPCFSQLLPCHPEVILGLNSPLQGEAPAGAAENTGWAQRGRGQKAESSVCRPVHRFITWEAPAASSRDTGGGGDFANLN